MKININKEYLFVALIFVAFIDYDIFVFLALIYFLIYSFYNSEFEFSNLIKRTIYLQVSFFTIFIKFAPILNSKFLKIYNNISQQNYLSLDGKFYSENIFYDLQTFLYGLYCNRTNIMHDDYLTKYEELILSCPFGPGYGLLYYKISIEGNIWNLTLIISLISLTLLFLIYYFSVRNINNYKFMMLTLFFLSPPVNFLTFRLNFDLVIFIILHYFVKNGNANKFLRNTTFLVLASIKLYPIVFLFSFTVYDILKQKNLRQPLNFVFCIFGLYIIYLNNLTKGTDVYSSSNQSHRSYGLRNDADYLSELFNLKITFFFLALIFMVLICCFNFYKRLKIYKTKNFELHSVFFLISTGLFSNYDYKLIFLFYLVIFFLDYEQQFFSVLLFLFIYSSPSLLHAYQKYYKLVVNDEIFYLDFSFYIVYSLCIVLLFRYTLEIFRKIKL